MSDPTDQGRPEPVDGQEPSPPASDVHEEEPACEECGAPLETGQAYCLTCGEPTPAAPSVEGSSRATGLLAAGLIIAGLGAGAIGFAVANDDGGGSDGTASVPVTDATTSPAPPASTEPTPTVVRTTEPTPTTPGVTTPPATTAPSTTGIPETTLPSTTRALPPATTISTPGTTATTTVTTTRTVTTPPGALGRSTDDWPDGRSGWTAVVKSTGDESEARATEARLAATGKAAGILRSRDYSSLRDGYFVVFSGTYRTREQAAAQARSLQGTFPNAYPRAVVP